MKCLFIFGAVVHCFLASQLVQGFKDIRSKAAELLKRMSSTLVDTAEKEATIEGRKAFVDGCKPIWESSTVRASFACRSDAILMIYVSARS